MKLSISLPDPMAKEIKVLAGETERSISWYLQRAWDLARTRLMMGSEEARRSHRRFMKTFESLRGILKEDFPDMDSVTLSHQAFTIKKKS